MCRKNNESLRYIFCNSISKLQNGIEMKINNILMTIKTGNYICNDFNMLPINLLAQDYFVSPSATGSGNGSIDGSIYIKPGICKCTGW